MRFRTMFGSNVAPDSNVDAPSHNRLDYISYMKKSQDPSKQRSHTDEINGLVAVTVTVHVQHCIEYLYQVYNRV